MVINTSTICVFQGLVFFICLSGFFADELSNENERFQQLASALSDNFRFAHTFIAEVQEKFAFKKLVAYLHAHVSYGNSVVVVVVSN